MRASEEVFELDGKQIQPLQGSPAANDESYHFDMGVVPYPPQQELEVAVEDNKEEGALLPGNVIGDDDCGDKSGLEGAASAISYDGFMAAEYESGTFSPSGDPIMAVEAGDATQTSYFFPKGRLSFFIARKVDADYV